MIKKLKSLVCILPAFLCLCPIHAYASEENSKCDYVIDDYKGYDYEVLPETEEWPYGNHQKMVDVCQVPEEIYMEMATEQLAQTVVCYPLLGDMLFYDDIDEGYEIVKSHFGALQELSKRDDARYWLEDIYDNLQSKYETLNNEEESELKTKISLCISDVLTLLDRDDFNTEDVTNNYSASYLELNNSVYTVPLLTSSTTATPVSFVEIVSTISTGTTSIHSLRGGVMTGYSMSVLEKWNYSDGSIRTDYKTDLSTDAKNSLNYYVASSYRLTPISNCGPTVKYNCHAYAWYYRGVGNYWVNDFTSTNYTQTTAAAVPIGGIAVYYNTINYTTASQYTHSAVISANAYDSSVAATSGISGIVVKSKWGMGGLYQHGLENCPYYYDTDTYLSSPQPYYIRYYK